MTRAKLTFETLDVGYEEPLSLRIYRHEVIKRGLVPTGSTLLNLALSGNPFGGFRLGSIVNIVGDSHAGKTFLFWQMMAEIVHSKQKHLRGHKLIYDDAEAALNIPIKQLFGKKIDRVDRAYSSNYMEELFAGLNRLLKKDKKFIYGIDSLDSLEAKEVLKKKDDDIGKREIPSEPRVLKNILRNINAKIERTDSLFCVISQTRKNIGVMFGEKQRRAGGDALRFFSTHELWLAVRKHIARKKMDVGIITKVKIRKNKLTGKQSIVEFPIYVDYGIDDVGSMIDWMVEKKFWSSSESDKSKLVKTHGDFIDGTPNKLIKHIESNDLEEKLIGIVTDCWNQLIEETRTKRKRRY